MQLLKAGNLKFYCDTEIERWRVETAFTKEEGTVAWLRDSLKPGQCFADVGANIGIYTMMAAELVGPTGMVYAFEPHVGNAASLIRNIIANGFQDRVTAVSAAVDDAEGFVTFFYQSPMPGSSGSQLYKPIGEDGQEFVAAVTELKACVRLRELPFLRTPNHVKIDTDGNELFVLAGMLGMNVETIQIEVHQNHADAIAEMMANRGYVLYHRHYTANGKKQIANGADPLKITHNAVYGKVA